MARTLNEMEFIKQIAALTRISNRFPRDSILSRNLLANYPRENKFGFHSTDMTVQIHYNNFHVARIISPFDCDAHGVYFIFSDKKCMVCETQALIMFEISLQGLRIIILDK